MSRPGIDVIVPCYNYGRYLEDCIASVLQERRLPIRVLIIDDASPDGSAHVAHRLAAEDRRIKVVAHPANRGHIHTYNEGIDWVEQQYMLLLSADDMVAPDALARAVGVMEAHPQVAFVHGDAIRFTDPMDLVNAGDRPAGWSAKVQGGAEFIEERCASSLNPVHTATAVVRTAIQKQVGGYCPRLPHAGDLEMWLRLAGQGDVGFVSGVQGFVRLHANNMHLGYSGAGIIEDYRQRRDAFAYFFEHHSAALPNVARLEHTARRTLAMELLWEASRAVEAHQSATEIVRLAEELWPGIRLTSRFFKLGVKRRIWPLLAQRAAPAPVA